MRTRIRCIDSNHISSLSNHRNLSNHSNHSNHNSSSIHRRWCAKPHHAIPVLTHSHHLSCTHRHSPSRSRLHTPSPRMWSLSTNTHRQMWCLSTAHLVVRVVIHILSRTLNRILILNRNHRLSPRPIPVPTRMSIPILLLQSN